MAENKKQDPQNWKLITTMSKQCLFPNTSKKRLSFTEGFIETDNIIKNNHFHIKNAIILLQK